MADVLPASPPDAASLLRERRLRYAVGTSLASKVATAVVQIVAFPIAARALGQRPFVLYAMLASVVGWLGLLNIGVGPPLAVSMSEATARGDRLLQRRLLSSALLPIACLALLAGGALSLVSGVVPPAAIFGTRYETDAATIQAGLALLTLVFLTQTVLSVVEAAQLGFQEQYQLNAMAVGGNLATAAAIVGVAALRPSVVGMIAAVSVPPLLFRLANAGWVFLRRPYLFPSFGCASWRVAKTMLKAGAAFSLAGGLGNFLCHQFPVVLMGRRLPSADAASFAVAVNALMIAAGMVSMVTVPLWPAVSDGMARGDLAWVSRTYRRVLSYSVAYGLLVALVFAVYGRTVFRLWFGPSIDVDTRLSVPLGVYFVLLMWENAHLAVLIGMKQIAVPSILLFCRSVAAVVITVLLVQRLGASAAFVALAVSVCVFTLFPLKANVRRVLTTR